MKLKEDWKQPSEAELQKQIANNKYLHNTTLKMDNLGKYCLYDCTNYALMKKPQFFAPFFYMGTCSFTLYTWYAMPYIAFNFHCAATFLAL